MLYQVSLPSPSPWCFMCSICIKRYTYRPMCTRDNATMENVVLAAHNSKQLNSYHPVHVVSWSPFKVSCAAVLTDLPRINENNLCLWWELLWRTQRESIRKHMSSWLLWMNVFNPQPTFCLTGLNCRCKLQFVFTGRELDWAGKVRVGQWWPAASPSSSASLGSFGSAGVPY